MSGVNNQVLKIITKLESGNFGSGIKQMVSDLSKAKKATEKVSAEQAKLVHLLKRAGDVVGSSQALKKLAAQSEKYYDAVREGNITQETYKTKIRGVRKEVEELILANIKGTKENEKMTQSIKKQNKDLERAKALYQQVISLGTRRKGLGAGGQQTLKSSVEKIRAELAREGDFRRDQVPGKLPEGMSREIVRQWDAIQKKIDLVNKEYKHGKEDTKRYEQEMKKLLGTKRMLRLALQGEDEALDKVARGAKKTARSMDHYEEQTKKASNATIRLSQRSEGFLRKLSTLRNRILVYTFALAGTVRALTRYVKMTAEAEKQTLALQAVARNTGNNFDDVQKAANQLASDGILSVEGVTQALKNLLSTGADLPIIVENLDAMKEAAVANGRAHFTAEENIIAYTQGVKEQKSQLTDSAGVMTNLSTIIKNHKKEIEQLGEANAILVGFTKEAKSQFEGALAPVLESLSGKLQTVGVQLDITRKKIGQVIQPLAIGLVDGTAALNEKLQRWIDLYRDELSGVLDGLTGWFTFLREIFITLVTAIAPFVKWTIELIKWSGKLLSLFQLIPDQMQKYIRLIGALAASYLVVIPRVGRLVKHFIEMNAVLNILTATTKRAALADKFLNFLFRWKKPIMVAITALAALTIGIISYVNAQKKALQEQRNFFRMGEKINDSLDKQRDLISKLRGEYNDLSENELKNVVKFLTLQQQIQAKQNEINARSVNQISMLGSTTNQLRDELRDLVGRYEELEKKGVGKTVQEINERLGEGVRVVSLAVDGQEEFGVKIGDNIMTMEAFIEKIESMDRAGGQVENVRINMENVEKETENVKTQLQSATRELEKFGKEGVAAFSIDLRHQIEDYEKGISESAKAVVELNKRLETTHKRQSQLRAMLPSEMGMSLDIDFSSEEIEGAREALNKLGKTEVEINKSQEKVNESMQTYRDLIQASLDIYEKQSQQVLDKVTEEFEVQKKTKTELEGKLQEQDNLLKKTQKQLDLSKLQNDLEIQKLQAKIEENKENEKLNKIYTDQIESLRRVNGLVNDTLDDIQSRDATIRVQIITESLDQSKKTIQELVNEISKFGKGDQDEFGIQSLFRDRENLIGQTNEELEKAHIRLQQIKENAGDYESYSAFFDALEDGRSQVISLSEGLKDLQDQTKLDLAIGKLSQDLFGDVENQKLELQAKLSEDLIDKAEFREQFQDLSNTAAVEFAVFKQKFLANTKLSKEEAGQVIEELEKAFKDLDLKDPLKNAEQDLSNFEQFFQDTIKRIINSVSDLVFSFAEQWAGLSESVWQFQTEHEAAVARIEVQEEKQVITTVEAREKLQALDQERLAMQSMLEKEIVASRWRMVEGILESIAKEAAVKALIEVAGALSPTQSGSWSAAAAYGAAAVAAGGAAMFAQKQAMQAERSATIERARVEERFNQSTAGQQATASREGRTGGTTGGTVQAQPMNVNISPSITISGEVISVGGGGAEALAEELTSLIIGTTQNAINDGRLDLSNAANA